MSKIGLVIKHEYTQRVMKKSFILLTLLTPLLFLALILVPLGLAQINNNDVERVAVVDNVGKYAQLFTSDDSYEFITIDNIPADQMISQSEENDYTAILVISQDLMEHPEGATIYSNNIVSNQLQHYINSILSDFTEQERIDSYNIPDLKEIMESTRTPLEIRTVKWDKNGDESESSAEVAMLIGMIFTMLMYMFVFVYGAQVMNSVMQEKTSRIVEVLVCSVRPFELMMGKIVSMALVGLTQLLIWAVLTTALTAIAIPFFSPDPETLVNASAELAAANGNMPPMDTESISNEIFSVLGGINIFQIAICFILFFIGGYLLYSSLFAAIGSAVDSETDTQQFMFPIMIPVLFGLYAAMYSIENPDGPLAFWCSIIPFTSPIVMMVRLPYSVPFWQLALSLGLLYVTFVGAVWASGKIYRTGILMYGKKVTWKELIKWLKY